MAPAVDAQFTAGHMDWQEMREAALAAEDAGYSALWIVDHLAGKSMGGEQSLEAFTWLGALAASTSRIELGSLVLNVWNREVGVSVLGATTVAAVSGRRFWFGLGAGTSPVSSFAWEQQMVGAHIEPVMARRHDRVEAVLDLCARMWDGPTEEMPTFLRPPVRPVTVVGVNSVRLATITGRRADGINVAWHHPRRDEFLAACRTAVADRPFVWTTYLRWEPGLDDPEHPTRQAIAAAGMDRVILLHTGVPDIGRAVR
jgi:alkanesulfonate monooxygenase SsuD/methylene tetrahydromethanopterin reductase-like flavin-dependent oxidoreductase (luciferase family)